MKPFTPMTGACRSRVARCAAANLRRSLALLPVILAAAGCAVTPPTEAPPPPVQLVSAGELNLPSACIAAPGAVYRTLFEVQPDGRVAAPRSEPTGDDCVKQALREWVETFRYAPIAASTSVAYDWMAVTASRHQ